MVLTSDDSSEDDDDDIYIGAAARLKALMKKGPPLTPLVNFHSSFDSEKDIPPVSPSLRTMPERACTETRNSCETLSPLALAAVHAPEKADPKLESIDPDDSDESDEPDYTVDVKVKWKSRGIVRLELKRHETFEKIFKHFAESEGVSEKRILVLKGNKPVLSRDTPASVGLRVIDILEGGILNTEVEDAEPKELVDACRIKVQMSTKGKIVVDLGKKDRFDRVMSICAEKLDVAASRIKLSFDGEDIEADDTPESLQLEEEACVDLRLATLL